MKLTTSARKKRPSSKFAGPGRSFPVNDKAPAAKAIQLAPRSVKVGNITSSQAETIRSRARAVVSGKNLIKRP